MSCQDYSPHTPLLLASHTRARTWRNARQHYIHETFTLLVLSHVRFSRTFLYYIYYHSMEYIHSTIYYILVFIYLLHTSTLVFATSILRIYRNNNARYTIINSVLPVVFQIHTCFIVLRKVSSITLGVFIGQRSSGSYSSSVAKFQSTNNIRRPVGIRNHTPQARGVADKRHWQ